MTTADEDKTIIVSFVCVLTANLGVRTLGLVKEDGRYESKNYNIMVISP